MRWAAPEVLGEDGDITRKADVYAFGMVVIEVGPPSPYRVLDAEGCIIRPTHEPRFRSSQEHIHSAVSTPCVLLARFSVGNGQLARGMGKNMVWRIQYGI